jgi:hypothetical protein
MAKTFVKLTRTEIPKLSGGEKLIEHRITFERLRNADSLHVLSTVVDERSIRCH